MAQDTSIMIVEAALPSDSPAEPDVGTPVSHASVLPQTYSSQGLAALPMELLYLIFQPLRPEKYQHHRDADVSQAYGVPVVAHINALRRFCDLRMLCSVINSVLAPIVYQELVIYLRRTSHLERIMGVFESAAPHVRSVVIYGEPRVPDGTEAVIGRGLNLCSQITNLECYGNHNTFTTRGWAKMAPILKFNISSLIFCPRGRGSDLSHSLIALGPHLQRLEVLDWQRPREGSAFHLPSEMPNLTELVLVGGSPKLEDITKLVARFIKKEAPKEQRVNLRSLSLVEVNTTMSKIMAILTTNALCSQLTSLRLNFGMNHLGTNGMPLMHAPSFAVSVVKARPKLVNFSYIHLLDMEVLSYLHPALELLELGLFPPFQKYMLKSPWTEKLVAFISSEQCPALRKLSIPGGCSVHSSGGLNLCSCYKVRLACDKFGVELSTY
jgi:hypothetical protein